MYDLITFTLTVVAVCTAAVEVLLAQLDRHWDKNPRVLVI